MRASARCDRRRSGDREGHGTHVASIAAGSGAASSGRFRGVAPDAELISGRVCGERCALSSVLAAMEWAVVTKGARVVNMSFGMRDEADQDPVEQALDRLSAETGALFVVSAGNNGGRNSVASPAAAAAALAVGAVDRDDELAGFSNRGPGPGVALKPEITAPGVEIVAAHSSALEPEGGDPFYVAKSGTSMAAPHVAGAAALLFNSTRTGPVRRSRPR